MLHNVNFLIFHKNINFLDANNIFHNTAPSNSSLVSLLLELEQTQQQLQAQQQQQQQLNVLKTLLDLSVTTGGINSTTAQFNVAPTSQLYTSQQQQHIPNFQQLLLQQLYGLQIPSSTATIMPASVRQQSFNNNSFITTNGNNNNDKQVDSVMQQQLNAAVALHEFSIQQQSNNTTTQSVL